MIIWVDAHLSPSLAAWINRNFPDIQAQSLNQNIDHRSGFRRRFACPVQKNTDNPHGIGISRKNKRRWNPFPAALHLPAVNILEINVLQEYFHVRMYPSPPCICSSRFFSPFPAFPFFSHNPSATSWA